LQLEKKQNDVQLNLAMHSAAHHTTKKFSTL